MGRLEIANEGESPDICSIDPPVPFLIVDSNSELFPTIDAFLLRVRNSLCVGAGQNYLM